MSELKIFNKDHLMLDLETFSTNQNAAIIQIGAVIFTMEDGPKHEFLINVDPLDCKKYGCHFSRDTIEWWKTQPKEVQDSWKTNPKPLKSALQSFNSFIGPDAKTIFMWAHGSVFDFGILRSAYEATGIARPWEYWNENDMRTVMNILGINHRTIRKKDSNYHNALADCLSQIETLRSIFLDKS